jgi:hypothetical protein
MSAWPRPKRYRFSRRRRRRKKREGAPWQGRLLKTSAERQDSVKLPERATELKRERRWHDE